MRPADWMKGASMVLRSAVTARQNGRMLRQHTAIRVQTDRQEGTKEGECDPVGGRNQVSAVIQLTLSLPLSASPSLFLSASLSLAVKLIIP